MDQERLKAAHRVGKRAQLIDLVVLESFSMRTQEQGDMEQLIRQYRLIVDTVETKPVSDTFWAEINTGVRFVELDENEDVKNVAVEFGAKFQLAYKISNRRDITKEDINHFCKLNAVHHTWPFWRELVHSMAGRMGYSNILLPLRAPLHEPAGKPSSSEESKPKN